MVMLPKMVGDSAEKTSRKISAGRAKSVSLRREPKRRKALLGSNLPRDRFARYDSISGGGGCQGRPNLFDMQDYLPMPQKTQASSVRLAWRVPFFVVPFPEVDVPLDIVAVVLLRQSPMDRYVLLEVSEVGFKRIGGLWYAWVVKEPEHVGQGPSDVHVGLPDHLVREPFRVG